MQLITLNDAITFRRNENCGQQNIFFSEHTWELPPPSYTPKLSKNSHSCSVNMNGKKFILDEPPWGSFFFPTYVGKLPAMLTWSGPSQAGLTWADLTLAEPTWAGLTGAELTWADLCWSDRSWPTLSQTLPWETWSEPTELSWSDLSWTCGADLHVSSFFEGPQVGWWRWWPSVLRWRTSATTVMGLRR